MLLACCTWDGGPLGTPAHPSFPSFLFQTLSQETDDERRRNQVKDESGRNQVDDLDDELSNLRSENEQLNMEIGNLHTQSDVCFSDGKSFKSLFFFNLGFIKLMG